MSKFNAYLISSALILYFFIVYNYQFINSYYCFMMNYLPEIFQGKSDWENSSLYLKFEIKSAHSLSLILSVLLFFFQMFSRIQGAVDPFAGESVLRRFSALFVLISVMLSWYFSFGANEPISEISEAATSERGLFNSRYGIVVAAFIPNFLALWAGELARDIIFKRDATRRDKDVDVGRYWKY